MKKNTQPFLFIREAGRNIRLDLQQIIYIEARRNYTRVVTRDKTFMQLVVLNKWERVLPPEQFCQVHRSFIVSIGSIIAFDRKYVYLPGINIPFGEAYRDFFQDGVTILGTGKIIKPSTFPASHDLLSDPCPNGAFSPQLGQSHPDSHLKSR